LTCIPDPDTIYVSSVQTNSDCYNEGRAWVEHEGLTEPYTITWRNSAGQTVGTGDTVTGLSAGDYTVTLISENDVTVVMSFVIRTGVIPTYIIVRPDTSIMIGSSITLWSTPDATMWYELPDMTALGFGNQVVQPTDTTMYLAELINTCGIFYDTVRIYIAEEAIPLEPSHVTLDYFAGCIEGDGWAVITISDEPTHPPFTFLWNDGNTDSVRTNLNTGIYSVQIKDALGNTVTRSFTLTLTSPITMTSTTVAATVEACDDGRIRTSVRGGTPPYYFYWDDDYPDDPNLWIYINDSNRFNMEAGLHILTIADSKGCEAEFVIELNCNYRRKILPTLFISPNGDGYNDYLKILNIDHYPNNRVIIFNSYGEQIVELRNYNNTTVRWDGKNLRGEVLPDGVFYYIVEAVGVEPMAGWILMKGSKSR
jgi:gliding motility-associated-like protein